MGLRLPLLTRTFALTLFTCLLAGTGCGGNRGMAPASTLTVTVVDPNVILHRGGTAVVAVRIVAPTESVLLQLNSLPAGVTATYAATESNPSGTLKFVATGKAPTGKYSPTVTVVSGERAASMVFSLEVDPATP